MKILLINTNREKVPYPVMPIGLCYVASALKEAGHEVELLDLCFQKDPEMVLRTVLASRSFQMVGLGIRNLDNCDYFRPKNFLPEAKAYLDICRTHTTAPLVIGGPAVSIMPEDIFDLLKPDFAVVGEGEQTLKDLADALEAKSDYTHLSGLCWREKDAIQSNPPQPASFSLGITPQIYKWIEVQPYLKFEGVYPIQSKRGCALGCTYCTYVNLEGRDYRFRSGQDIADELEDIYIHTGLRDFEFVDSTFNAPPSHAIDICKHLVKKVCPSDL